MQRDANFNHVWYLALVANQQPSNDAPPYQQFQDLDGHNAPIPTYDPQETQVYIGSHWKFLISLSQALVWVMLWLVVSRL